jgi:hypothetical protein
MAGPVTASQLFNTQRLTPNQRKVVDDGLAKVQQGGDPQVNNALKFAAHKVKQSPDTFSIKFGALPEKPNSVTYGRTLTKQSSDTSAPDAAKITLNANSIFKGDESKQKQNFIGTLFNELASMFAPDNSKNHEMVSDLMEAHAVKALKQGEQGTAKQVAGSEIVQQANAQRGGSLQNMNKLDVYANKKADASSPSVAKLEALGLVNQDQATAMRQAANIAAEQPIDRETFKADTLKKTRSGSQLSLQA